jgi:hypothetical protein
MTDDDSFPNPVLRAVEFARDELRTGFAPNPADTYEPTGKWNAGTDSSRRSFTGLGVNVIRDEHSDTPGDKKWKVEVKMASRSSSDPLLIEDGLCANEMKNLIRAFQYRLNWFHQQGEYEPRYE